MQAACPAGRKWGVWNMAMAVTYDIYQELGLDRSWDEKTIKDHLKEIQKLWTRRQSATNDKDQLLLIDKVLKAVEDGFRYLIRPEQRKRYDRELDKAHKNGVIHDEAQEQAATLMDQARAYYNKGDIKLATQYAQQAVDQKINDPSAYDLLARCYLETQDYNKALTTLDAGTGLFPDNLGLWWLGARIADSYTGNYEDAQNRINHLIEMAPNLPIGYSEQIVLHLQKGEEDLAFQEIDSYVEKHPDDTAYKQNVAYGLCEYSNKCFYYDQQSNSTFIADKENYDECLKLRQKAVDLYSDEHTQDRLENAQYYGKKEWNSWNLKSIGIFTFYTIFLLPTLPPAGLIFLIMDILLIYYSFRPYWQINKTYVTGKPGKAEGIVNAIGTVTGAIIIWTIKIFIHIFIFIMDLIFHTDW